MGAQIKNRPVVVTGGGNGIGASLAQQAARRGAAHVVVVDVDLEAAQAVAEGIAGQGGAATARRCDITDAEAVEKLAQSIAVEHGTPALVCANAGVMMPVSPLLDASASDAEWVIRVNVGGTLHTLQSFGRLMAAGEQQGWLMATGSEHSVGVPHINGGAYTASKHAVLGMCDVMRAELPEHVGISVLCPGLTASRLWDSTRHRPDQYGGSADNDPGTGAFMEQMGMSAETVAQRALDAIAAGHFLIPTHYNARAYAQKRADEMAEAFDRLAEIDTSDYDLTTRVVEFLESAAETPDHEDTQGN